MFHMSGWDNWVLFSGYKHLLMSCISASIVYFPGWILGLTTQSIIHQY